MPSTFRTPRISTTASIVSSWSNQFKLDRRLTYYKPSARDCPEMEASETHERMQSFVTRIAESDSVVVKHSIFSELYDILDVVTSSVEYDEFLKTLLPLILQQLQEVEISMDASSPEHKLRNTCLELLNRCPLNDKLEPMAVTVLDALLSLLKLENDENGVLCMKIMTSLFKSYKQQSQDKVEPFIAIIVEIYENVPNLVHRTFQQDAVSSNPSSNELQDSQEEDELEILSTAPPKHLELTTESFKTLSECPITMVTLFSSYKHLIQTELPKFLPLIIDLLTLEVEQQKAARIEMEKQGKKLISMCPEIKKRAAFCDYVLAQIKATSFLAYVFIRGYAADLLQQHVGKVPDLVMRLLQDCPSELSSARKELLHATRHILSTSYKKLFLPKIDLMFDQKVLIGDGFTSYETLRPLAYSTLADFIHNIRSDLVMGDIEKTVKIYTSFLLDESLALTVQIMSAKLLLNLIERILTLGKKDPFEAPKAKKLLMSIIESYTVRFKLLNSQHKKVLKQHKTYEEAKSKKSKEIQEQLAKDRQDIDEFMKSIMKSPNELFPEISNAEKSTDASARTDSADADKDGDIIMEDLNMKSLTEDGLAAETDNKKEGNSSSTDEVINEPLDFADLQSYAPIVLFQAAPNDPLKDAFYLYRTLLSFLKTIIHDLKVFNPPPEEYTTMNPKMWSALSRVFSYEEVIVLKNLFHECIAGLHLFSSNPEGINEQSIKRHFDITTPS